MVKEQPVQGLSVQGLSLPEHWLLVIKSANTSIPQVQPLKWIDEGLYATEVISGTVLNPTCATVAIFPCQTPY